MCKCVIILPSAAVMVKIKNARRTVLSMSTFCVFLIRLNYGLNRECGIKYDLSSARSREARKSPVRISVMSDIVDAESILIGIRQSTLDCGHKKVQK